MPINVVFLNFFFVFLNSLLYSSILSVRHYSSLDIILKTIQFTFRYYGKLFCLVFFFNHNSKNCKEYFVGLFGSVKKCIFCHH